LSNNEVRREAVDIVVIALISTFLISFGAVLLSSGLAYSFTAIPIIVERASSNATSPNDPVANVYEFLSRYSLQYSIVGTAMIIGGLAYGFVSYTNYSPSDTETIVATFLAKFTHCKVMDMPEYRQRKCLELISCRRLVR
jgi:hypothetical protein